MNKIWSIIFCLMTVGACAQNVTNIQQTEQVSAPIIITEQQNGQNITLAQNQEIQLVLPENPTTGYLWHIQVSPDILQETQNTFIAPDTPKGFAGAGGMRQITYQAIQSGTASITGSYYRSWEGKPNHDDFSCIIQVQ